jgi:hypothetical protein
MARLNLLLNLFDAAAATTRKKPIAKYHSPAILQSIKAGNAGSHKSPESQQPCPKRAAPAVSGGFPGGTSTVFPRNQACRAI